MTTIPTGFEFELPVDGNSNQYLVSAIHAEDGHLCRLTIWHNPPAAETIADIEIDPQIFKQFAMPNVETVCRIAIAQAASEGAFENAGSVGELTLDFAIEPWEGELAQS